MAHPERPLFFTGQRLPLVWLALLLLTLLSYYGLSRFPERAFVPLVLAASLLFTRLVDEPAIRLSDRFARLVMGGDKPPVKPLV